MDVSNVNVSALSKLLRLDDIEQNLDIFFVLTMAIIIFFMQCGFAFLEAGSVRSKNTTNILLKNLLDGFVSGIAYWSVGYAFAFGPGNFFIGLRHFFSESLQPSEYHMWFFHFVFAATSTTIVSGAMAERCEFVAYLVYSFVLTGVVYPVVSHWAWSDIGWLNVGNGIGQNYQDFAGSGVVHLLGGTAAFVGAAILKPRRGRFDKLTMPMRGHSIPLISLGGFILFFGFFAFNGGSQGRISVAGDGEAVAIAVMNTVLAGSFAAFTALVTFKLGVCCGTKVTCEKDAVSKRNWSLLKTINAALTGMVAVCAGCNVFNPWGAAAVGFVAGLLYLASSALVQALKVDDPLDSVAVHCFGGFLGLVAQPLLKKDGGIIFTGSRASFLDLGWNMIGALAIVSWTGVICTVMFSFLRVLGILRVSKAVEMRGLDVSEHGELAYPDIKCTSNHDTSESEQGGEIRPPWSERMNGYSNRAYSDPSTLMPADGEMQLNTSDTKVAVTYDNNETKF